MAESMPTKKDIEYLFKKLRSVQTNKVISSNQSTTCLCHNFCIIMNN